MLQCDSFYFVYCFLYREGKSVNQASKKNKYSIHKSPKCWKAFPKYSANILHP